MDYTDVTDETNGDLTALIGSRICHDLISPLGAIGNGVELLAMAGGELGPELTLISQSAQAANARIRFFRVAFGAAGASQGVGASDVRSILDDLNRGGRIRYDWEVAFDAPRAAVKLAFLALLCCESALPFGGHVVVSASGDNWRIAATADRLKQDDALWERIGGRAGAAQLRPAQVQFALLPDEARRQGRMLRLVRQPEMIVIGF